MFLSPYATERTRAHLEGRKENAAKMLHNRKPFRTKSQKAAAREDATVRGDGAYRSSAPVSYHPAPRGAA